MNRPGSRRTLPTLLAMAVLPLAQSSMGQTNTSAEVLPVVQEVNDSAWKSPIVALLTALTSTQELKPFEFSELSFRESGVIGIRGLAPSVKTLPALFEWLYRQWDGWKVQLLDQRGLVSFTVEFKLPVPRRVALREDPTPFLSILEAMRRVFGSMQVGSIAIEDARQGARKVNTLTIEGRPSSSLPLASALAFAKELESSRGGQVTAVRLGNRWQVQLQGILPDGAVPLDDSKLNRSSGHR